VLVREYRREIFIGKGRVEWRRKMAAPETLLEKS